ncbi:toxin-antitoxin system HicB family antitoxin [Pseudonocardia spinosispora]|uniref:toxin-antitoxin system HicB family antitoxin n=1 Tax=Pseudonocardia spinosispora TaxID=103441 RepID=UPI0003FA8F11|nr:toxin-antitoxin system HicB family antitoxin [Pseudonocardia spinosispora]
MDVTPYVTALREDLVSAAAAGDEQTQRTATLLAAAIEPAARLAVMNALTDLAEEVTEALEGERTVELRLNGRQVKVVVTDPPGAQPSEEPPTSTPPIGGAESAAGDISRITLRLMEEIKGHAEQAANRQGVSLNSWIAQAVQGALYGAQTRNHSRGRADWGPDAQRGRERGPRKNRDDGRSVRGWVQG